MKPKKNMPLPQNYLKLSKNKSTLQKLRKMRKRYLIELLMRKENDLYRLSM